MIKSSPSPIRRRYIARLIGRVLILIAGLILCFLRPEIYDILDGWHFLTAFPSCIFCGWSG